jgi:hypothetical protein
VKTSFEGLIMILASVVLAEPAGASEWLDICVAADSGALVHIKNAKTRAQLVPLKSGDLVYKISASDSDGPSPTFAFREGKMTEIVLRMDELEKNHFVNCVSDEPVTAKYPITVRDNPSEAQLIYNEFGIISDFFSLNSVKLGEHSRCPVSNNLFVAGWKSRELDSKGVPLARFCAAMSNNSWFWFDPETGQRRPDYQMVVEGDQPGATFFFKPIPCFLAAGTRIDLRAGEIRPKGCVFRYNPMTGKAISEQEGRALAELAVFAFGPGEKGGALDDTEGLAKQSARRLSESQIESVKGQ